MFWLCVTSSSCIIFINNFLFVNIVLVGHVIEPRQEKTCFMLYANNKDADQPAHPHSLISIFVVHFLDSIIPILAIFTILRL